MVKPTNGEFGGLEAALRLTFTETIIKINWQKIVNEIVW